MAKFMIRRTSEWGDASPCPGAYRESYTRIDERTVNDPAKVTAYKGQPTDWWYDEGRNHRVERGRIRRDFDAEAWFIDIDDLGSLMKLQDQYGDLILTRGLWNPDIRMIEIYDTYRE